MGLGNSATFGEVARSEHVTVLREALPDADMRRQMIALLERF